MWRELHYVRVAYRLVRNLGQNPKEAAAVPHSHSHFTEHYWEKSINDIPTTANRQVYDQQDKMPKQVHDIKQFIELCRRKDAKGIFPQLLERLKIKGLANVCGILAARIKVCALGF
jgi:Ribosomal L38e protein family